MLIGECLKYYSVNGFLMKTQDAEKFSNRMANKYRSMVGEEPGESQIKAWKDCCEALHRSLPFLPNAKREKMSIVFEYCLPANAPWKPEFEGENHLRTDVLLLSGNKVAVLEFKQSDTFFEGYRRQAQKYGRRLKKYHVLSKSMKIRCVCVLTGATELDQYDEGAKICSPDQLGKVLNKMFLYVSEPANMTKWLGSGFVFREMKE